MVKFHASLNVSDLGRAVRFYQALFGVGPAKHYPDYAKFEVWTPPLVLSLKPKRACAGGPLNHLGLRLLSVIRHEDVIADARGAAAEVVASDPGLARHPALLRAVDVLQETEQADYLQKA